jgi:hypothetical protein
VVEEESQNSRFAKRASATGKPLFVLVFIPVIDQKASNPYQTSYSIEGLSHRFKD